MISYWSFRHDGHACPAINYFKVTFFGTFIIWSESVLYLSGYCMSCILLLVCTDGRDIVECAVQRHESIWQGTIRLFVAFRECSPLRTRSSFKRFLYCGSKVLGVVQSKMFCVEVSKTTFRFSLLDLRCQKFFVPQYRFCRHPLSRPSMLPL